MIKLIIFDWDDVFSQGSKEGYLKCYHAAAIGVGVKLSAKEEQKRILEKWGGSQNDEIASLLQGYPESLQKKANEIYEQHLFGGTLVDSLSIIEGSQELLTRLSDKYILTISSGVHPKILKEHVMPKFHISEDIFDEIITVYDLDNPKYAKPHPHTAEMLMKKFNVKPKETIVVGDAKSDMMLAINSGAIPVAVLTGHLNKEQAEQLGVPHIIKSVIDLEKILQTI